MKEQSSVVFAMRTGGEGMFVCECKQCVTVWDAAIHRYDDEFHKLALKRLRRGLTGTVIVLLEHGKGGKVHDKTEHLALIEYPQTGG